MKSIKFAYIFILTFLFSLINSKLSNTELLIKEKDCKNYDSLIIKEQEGLVELNIANLCNELDYDILHLDIKIEINNFDLLKLELLNEDEEKVSLSFCFLDNESKCFHNTNILELSNILPGNYYLEITKKKENEEKEKIIKLKYEMYNFCFNSFSSSLELKNDIIIHEENEPKAIIITRNQDIYQVEFKDNITHVKLNATIDLDDKKADRSLDQFRYVKLVITKNNHTLFTVKELYASTNESFFNSDNLYNDSEFKTIVANYEISDVILSISLLKLKLNEKDFHNLFIRIPCIGICDFELNYVIEDARKLEGITIHHNSCFDIKLYEYPYNETSPVFYRFLVSTNKTNYPLISFTTTSTTNFTFLLSGTDNVYNQRNYYNGNSFTFLYDPTYYEFHTFLLQTNETMNFHICHRIIPEKKENITIFRKIKIGEEMLSTIKNFVSKPEDCFIIEKNDYDEYMMQYISKTRNLEIYYPNGAGENFTFYEETGNIFLNNTIESFCFNQVENWTEIKGHEAFSSINFVLLGIKNDIITQKYNIPLINGVPMHQNLKKGQILYYRLNDYLENSNYTILRFQSIKGDINVYKEFCYNYPECSFDVSMLEENKKINYTYERVIYLKEEIYSKDIYKSSSFPVYVVYCKDVKESDFCDYVIGVNTDDSRVSLIQHRKFYSFIEGEEDTSNKFSLIYNLITLNAGETSFLFFEIHLLAGKITDIYLNKEKNTKDFFNYDNKTFYYVKFPEHTGYNDYYIDIKGINNTFFYVYYYLSDQTKFASKYKKVSYIFSENEMQFNEIKHLNQIYLYSFPEGEKVEEYVIFLNGINTYIMLNGDDDLYRYRQEEELNSNIIRGVFSYKEGHLKEVAQFTASASKLINGTVNFNIDFDGLYKYFEVGIYPVKKVKLYQYFREEELKSKKMIININKDDLKPLKIQYGFNTTDESELQTRYVYKYNDIFTIDLSNVTLNKSYELKDIIERTNYFFIQINTEGFSCHFRIKTNIKNVPTYLYSDGIEYGYVNKKEPRYYYFDYVYSEVSSMIPYILQEVYLYNKGKTKIRAVLLKDKTDANKKYVYDIINVDYDDKNIWYNNTNSGINNIKIFEESCGSGCKLLFKVYLDENDESIDDNYTEFFTIYKNTLTNDFIYQINTNIFGDFYDSDQNYTFKIPDLYNIEGDLIITLNCQKCKMIFGTKKKSFTFTENGIIYNSKFPEEDLEIYLTGEIGSYFYFSISDSESPKYIEQLEEEPCFKSCQFIFPLHKFYNYSLDNESQIHVIFYIPNDEKVQIYYDLYEMAEFESDIVEKFDLTKQGMKNNNLSNILFFDINASDIMLKEKYLRIQLKSDDNKDFGFIMNKFINSPNTDNIRRYKNIVLMENNNEIKTDILSLDDNTFYKIEINLICGNGSVSLDNSGNYEYYLNQQMLESISVYVNLNKYNISSRKLGTEKNFTFFINATKVDIFEEKLDPGKTYRFKYIREENIINPDFLFLISCDNKENKTLFINYRFIDLEKNETGFDIYETSKEKFKMNPSTNPEGLIELSNVYLTDFRRGFISNILPSELTEKYLKFILEKEVNNEFIYKKIYLEITALYMEKYEEQDDIQRIDIPKNVYLQLDINKTTHLFFKEPNKEYNNVMIEIANNTEINITNIEEYIPSETKGKISYIPNNNKEEYEMIIKPKCTIFIKFSTMKSNIPNYDLWSNTIIKETINKNDNKYKLTYQNIKIYEDYINLSLFRITYYIRAYDYLLFYEDKDINNILNSKTAFKSFRKEVQFKDLKATDIKEEFTFGSDLGKMKQQYYINVIGEVTFNESIEYFAYESQTFRIDLIEEKAFEENWTYPLVIIILIFVASSAYIAFVYIKRRKDKKNKKNKDLNEVSLVNNKSGKSDD